MLGHTYRRHSQRVYKRVKATKISGAKWVAGIGPAPCSAGSAEQVEAPGRRELGVSPTTVAAARQVPNVGYTYSDFLVPRLTTPAASPRWPAIRRASSLVRTWRPIGGQAPHRNRHRQAPVRCGRVSGAIAPAAWRSSPPMRRPHHVTSSSPPIAGSVHPQLDVSERLPVVISHEK